MAYKYCTATNWGKNFFTHEERKQFHLSGHPGEVWVVGDNLYGDHWINKVSGVIKTKEEAQSIAAVDDPPPEPLSLALFKPFFFSPACTVPLFCFICVRRWCTSHKS